MGVGREELQVWREGGGGETGEGSGEVPGEEGR